MPTIGSTKIGTLRKHILAGRDSLLLDHPERVMMPLPRELEVYPMTPKMHYLENKYGQRIEVILFRGSLLDAQRFWKFEVDRGTLCRWRARIKHYLGEIYLYE